MFSGNELNWIWFLPDCWHSRWIRQVLQEAPHPLVPELRYKIKLQGIVTRKQLQDSCSYKALLQGNGYKATALRQQKNSHCQCCTRPKVHSLQSRSESPDQASLCILSSPKTWQKSGSRIKISVTNTNVNKSEDSWTFRQQSQRELKQNSGLRRGVPIRHCWGQIWNQIGLQSQSF